MTEQTLVDRPKCRRHYFIQQGRCPFCARPMEGRLAKMAMAAMTPMVLGACYGAPYKGTGFADSGPDGTTGNTGSSVGDITSGTYGLYIKDTCGIVWDMTGANTGDLSWDVSLTVNDATDCSGVTDTRGSLELVGGSAYFNTDYIGAATYGDGSFAWATNGYVTGVGGYSYYYSGYGNY